MSVVVAQDQQPDAALARREEWTPEQLQARIDREKAMRSIVVEYYRGAMLEGHHYQRQEARPGEDPRKPSLLKEGALNLASLFKVTPEFDLPVEEHGPDGHYSVFYRCRMVTNTGAVAATGDGSCTTREQKYGYRYAERTCPDCGQPTVIKQKEEKGGNWLCIGARGGCWHKFQKDDPRITSQEVGMVVNPNLADTYNTVLKMAKKRALVDAALQLPLVSELFTQDLEDMGGDAASTKPTTQPPAPAATGPGLPTKSSLKPVVLKNLADLGYDLERDKAAVAALTKKVVGKDTMRFFAVEDYMRMQAVTGHMLAGKGLEEAIALATGRPAPAPGDTYAFDPDAPGGVPTVDPADDEPDLDAG